MLPAASGPRTWNNLVISSDYKTCYGRCGNGRSHGAVNAHAIPVPLDVSDLIDRL